MFGVGLHGNAKEVLAFASREGIAPGERRRNRQVLTHVTYQG